MTLFAWAASMDAAHTVSALTRFPGVGAVLYSRNLDAAKDLQVPPIAYVTSFAGAHRVADLARAGVPFTAAIILDERNKTGPSGSYLTPDLYRSTFTLLAEPLLGLVPVHTMGLMPLGGFLRDTFRCRGFDDDYHDRLPPADGRAFNPNGVRRRTLERVLDLPGPWLLSPAPFRGLWDRFWSPVSLPEWARISEREEVRAVALWCLREVQEAGGRWQVEHGLLDRQGDLTSVGRAVLALS